MQLSYLVSDIMPSKHNSLSSIIYLVIRLQCFDPLLGHHQAYIKTESVLHFIFYLPIGIPCDLQGCTQFVQGATKNGLLNVVTRSITRLARVI
jgi:hypothetical protein